jgi:hypothetical protein
MKPRARSNGRVFETTERSIFSGEQFETYRALGIHVINNLSAAKTISAGSKMGRGFFESKADPFAAVDAEVPTTSHLGERKKTAVQHRPLSGSAD